MTIFRDSFNAVNKIFASTAYGTNMVTPEFICNSIYNCRGVDVFDSKMIKSDLNDTIQLYFIFTKEKMEDLTKVELFIDNSKRNIAFIIPDSIYTSDMLDYGKMIYIEKIYKYLFSIIKLPFKEACSKPYKESELHYLLDIAPDIFTLFTVFGIVNSESLKFIPKWLKHEAPRYDYDNRLIEGLLTYETIADLFDDYKVISVIKDIYDPLDKTRVKKDDAKCLIVQ